MMLRATRKQQAVTPPRRPVRLTPPMRAALEQAEKPGGIQRRHTDPDHKPAWPHHPCTLAALVRHELADHEVDRDARTGALVERWIITDAGLAVLYPPPIHRVDPPEYLQRDVWRGGDYTTERHRAIDPLPIMTPADMWAEHAAARHRRAQDRAERARQLRRRNAA